MRIAYFGTPDFAVPGLETLLAHGHRIVAVYTQPPRPAGRGQAPRPSAVQAFGEDHNLPVRTPLSLKEPAVQDDFRALAADAAVVAAYGLILPQAILDSPAFGCLNIHASLLPRWRGAAPIQRAILAGDRETGITIMQMDAGLDTGDIRLARSIPIADDETAAGLHDKLARLGGELIGEVIAGLADGGFPSRPQPGNGATYANKLDKAESRLDWSRPAVALERQIRAFTPWPGTWFKKADSTATERVKVLEAEIGPDNANAAPGTVLDHQLSVACGEGCLRILRAQRPGKEALDSQALLRGWSIPPGTILR